MTNQTEIRTVKRISVRAYLTAERLRIRANQLASAVASASEDANISQLPQTVWKTIDKDAPFMSKVSGSEFKSELKAQPILTVLPVNYFV